LQDTYLRARNAWDGFRGGDARAWLAMIARHAFSSHRRKRYLQAEVSLEVEAELPAPATDEHRLADLRQALMALSPALRDALIMKHYGGFSDVAGNL
jgi:RNA polymerase sigma-70 factor (ECF subfamily)